MNTPYEWRISLAPEISQALHQWQQALNTSWQDAQTLANAPAPWEQTLHTSQSTLAFLNSLNWPEVLQNALKPTVWSEWAESCADIQAESLNRWHQEQQQLLNSLQPNTPTPLNPQNPAHIAASTLEASLNAFNAVKTCLSNQAQVLSSTQSAWLALFQQTLSELSTPAPKTPPPAQAQAAPLYD